MDHFLRRGRAFCPGHVTGFFNIVDEADEFYKKGSRGSGFNTRAGVLSTGAVSNDMNEMGGDFENTGNNIFVRLSVDDIVTEKDELTVTREMITHYFENLDRSVLNENMREKTIFIRLDTHFELPLSQGFGMSGAGLLSQILVLNELLGAPHTLDECIRTAHMHEVSGRTGLGDIAAQSVGGFTIRSKEGVPPFGIVRSYPLRNRIILAVLGKGIRTKNVLTSPESRRRVNESSRLMVDRLLTDPTIYRMVDLSVEFARKSNLMSDDMDEICSTINTNISPGASMCMLGNSIFVIFPEEIPKGDPQYDKIRNMLEKRGEIFETSICPEGAKLL